MAINPNTAFTAGQVLTAAQMNRLPRGVVAAQSADANFTYDTTEKVTITATTFTAEADRLYRLTYFEPQAPPPAGTNTLVLKIRLTNTSGTTYVTGRNRGETNNVTDTSVTLIGYTTFSAGSTVIVGTAITPNVGGAATLTRSATQKAFIIVEDMGPA